MPSDKIARRSEQGEHSTAAPGHHAAIKSRPLFRRIIAFSAFFLTLAFCFVAWVPSMPRHNLDSAWKMVLNHAFAAGMAFGRQIIFTFGPYGFVTSDTYNPKTFSVMLLGQILIALATALCLERLIWRRTSTRWWTIPLLVAVLIIGENLDIMLLCAFIMYWQVERERTFGLTDLLVLPAIALLALTKFTVFVIVAGLIAAIAADDLFRKRFPWRSSVLTCLTLLFWLLAGQPIFGLWDFIASSLSVASGYSGAMAIWSMPQWHVLIGIAAILCIGASFIFAYRRSEWRAGLPHLFAVGLLLYMLFKNAFVRHDEHDLILLGHLPLLAVCYMLLFGLSRKPWLVQSFLVGALLFPSAIAFSQQPDYFRKTYLVSKARLVAGRETVLKTLISGHWLSSIKEMHEQSLATIRQADPVQNARGTIDVYSARQWIPFAYDMDYDPRPVFQSYSAYTGWLARKNADHLLGPQAPQTILFAVEPIDHRLPSMDDGLSWPLILSLYDLAGNEGDLLRFERSSAPRRSALDLLDEKEARLDQSIDLPDTPDGLIWAEADMRLSLSGKLLNLLFKVQPPILYVNDKTEINRLIPDLMRSGFLISPDIRNTDDFANLATGKYDNLEHVRKIRIDCAPKWRFCYQSPFRMKFYHLTFGVK